MTPKTPASTIHTTSSAARPGRHDVRLAVRTSETNPNHHLWNNRGTWWCHFTVHCGDFTARRVRVSLKTRTLETARRRRDAILRDLGRPGTPAIAPESATAA